MLLYVITFNSWTKKFTKENILKVFYGVFRVVFDPLMIAEMERQNYRFYENIFSLTNQI